MAFKNCTELKIISSKLEEMMDENEEEVVDSFLKKLSMKVEFDWLTLTAGYPNPGHNCWLPKGWSKTQKVKNREFLEIDTMTNIDLFKLW